VISRRDVYEETQMLSRVCHEQPYFSHWKAVERTVFNRHPDSKIVFSSVCFVERRCSMYISTGGQRTLTNGSGARHDMIQTTCSSFYLLDAWLDSPDSLFRWTILLLVHLRRKEGFSSIYPWRRKSVNYNPPTARSTTRIETIWV